MTFALATLAFLTTIWMFVVLGAMVLDNSGAKILAALKGESVRPMLSTRPVRVRHQRYQPLRPVRATARNRAAA